MIVCPRCQSDSSVLDSRPKSATIIRRRQCKKCTWRWRTEEVPSNEKVKQSPYYTETTS